MTANCGGPWTTHNTSHGLYPAPALRPHTPCSSPGPPCPFWTPGRTTWQMFKQNSSSSHLLVLFSFPHFDKFSTYSPHSSAQAKEENWVSPMPLLSFFNPNIHPVCTQPTFVTGYYVLGIVLELDIYEWANKTKQKHACPQGSCILAGEKDRKQ